MSGETLSGAWRVVGASVQGLSHRQVDRPCQDAHGYWRDDAGRLVVVVADGAGSATHSDLGSRTAVDATLELLRAEDSAWRTCGPEEDWRAFFRGTMETVRARLDVVANDRSVPLRELATTLAIVIAREDTVAAAQVGDGAVIGMDDAGVLQGVIRPAHSEYANETDFIVSRGGLDAMQLAVTGRPLAGIAATTDGLQFLALRMPAGEPSEKFFTPMFATLRETADERDGSERLAALLQSERFSIRADDDLTLVLAHRVGAHLSAPDASA